MRRAAGRAGQLVRIQLEVRHLCYLHLDMELRNGKVLLQISPEAMANTAALSEDEKEKLMTPGAALYSDNAGKNSLYQRLQNMTRGYLWLVVASMVLILAAGILLFPQKMWNRVMLSLFGCITFHVRGKAYRFCEQPPAAEAGGIPL